MYFEQHSYLSFQREVISLQIGQTGCQIGSACWELYCLEHGLQPDGFLNTDKTDKLESSGTFFSETSAGKHVPRTAFLDCEPYVVDDVRVGTYRELYNPEQLINGKEDAASNYSLGYHALGRELVDRCMDRIRKLVEECESLQGFLISNSMSGGTGSGFTSLLMQRMKQEYKNTTHIQCSVMPSPNYSDIIVSPYNAVLTSAESSDFSEVVILFDNEALYNICSRNLDIEKPSYRNINRLIAQIMTSLTASTRFNGSLDANIAQIQTNLIPYPRIKYLTATYAPFIASEKAHHEQLSVADITNACFEPANQTLNFDNQTGRIISCCVLYRGDLVPSDVNKAIASVKTKKSIKMVTWVRSNFKVGITYKPPMVVDGGDLGEVNRAACRFTNTSSIEEVWSGINDKYDKLYARRAFVHWYVGAGMEENELNIAREDLAALEKDYYYENTSYCNEYEEDE